MSDTAATATTTMKNLRIACLEPSATAICLALGLQDSIVGVTHECHELLLDPELLLLRRTTPSSSSPSAANDDDDDDDYRHIGHGQIRTLTKNGLTVTSQKDIHQAVQDAAAAAKAKAAWLACPRPSKDGDDTTTAPPPPMPVQEIPSLYPLLSEELMASQPSVIFTQDLCAVCAPTVKDVQEVLLLSSAPSSSSSSASSSSPTNDHQNHQPCQVVSLQPHTLEEVAETFVTVARACGVEERGRALQQQWLDQFRQLQHAVETSRDATLPPPRMLILEWLDPPFDGGHWTYQMMDHAGVVNANSLKTQQKQNQNQEHAQNSSRTTTTTTSTTSIMDEPKSKQIDWSFIESEACDPDVIVVGCCGFDLARNVQDVHDQVERFQTLRAGILHERVFACNGNIYIAQPGPSLLQGAVVLAKCAHHNQPKVLEAIDALGFLDPQEEAKAWKHINIQEALRLKKEQAKEEKRAFKVGSSSLFQPTTTTRTTTVESTRNTTPTGIVATTSSRTSTEPAVMDMEDLMGGEASTTTEDGTAEVGFAILHELACQQGQKTYIDIATGYSVMTAVAHKERGWCCGSGCRHCPYSHQNVKDKAARIQQPSILYRMKEAEKESQEETTANKNKEDTPTSGSKPPLFSIRENVHTKVLFFSGGKDSFLTIRALAREYNTSEQRFGLVLLTTFDATTRTIAHQNVKIDDVIQQASHLNITLVGIPLRRGSGETYQERIERGLVVIQEELLSNETSRPQQISSLVFGDLHLDHIKEWRDKTLSKFSFPYRLEYPLWKFPYATLMEDLEASQVPCIISGSTVDDSLVAVGTTFDRVLYENAISLGLDGFGEKGEFHSLAQVWLVPRETALGITIDHESSRKC